MLSPTPPGWFPVSGASHLNLFEQPLKIEFFSKRLWGVSLDSAEKGPVLAALIEF
jgi:hypothetical protein